MNRAAAALGCSVVLFAAFAADLLLHGPLTAADAASSSWLHAHLLPAVTPVVFIFTRMHTTIGIIAMSVALAVGLVATGRARWVPWLVLTVQGGQLLNVLVKEQFRRARPHFDDPLVTLDTYSFPSGHACGAAVFWGFVCVLAWNLPLSPAARKGVAAVAVVMVLMAPFSRVYLGAHYVSDVLAGISEGVGWVAMCTLARGRLARA